MISSRRFLSSRVGVALLALSLETNAQTRVLPPAGEACSGRYPPVSCIAAGRNGDAGAGGGATQAPASADRAVPPPSGVYPRSASMPAGSAPAALGAAAGANLSAADP